MQQENNVLGALGVVEERKIKLQPEEPVTVDEIEQPQAKADESKGEAVEEKTEEKVVEEKQQQVGNGVPAGGSGQPEAGEKASEEGTLQQENNVLGALGVVRENKITLQPEEPVTVDEIQQPQANPGKKFEVAGNLNEIQKQMNEMRIQLQATGRKLQERDRLLRQKDEQLNRTKQAILSVKKKIKEKFKKLEAFQKLLKSPNPEKKPDPEKQSVSEIFVEKPFNKEVVTDDKMIGEPSPMPTQAKPIRQPQEEPTISVLTKENNAVHTQDKGKIRADITGNGKQDSKSDGIFSDNGSDISQDFAGDGIGRGARPQTAIRRPQTAIRQAMSKDEKQPVRSKLQNSVENRGSNVSQGNAPDEIEPRIPDTQPQKFEVYSAGYLKMFGKELPQNKKVKNGPSAKKAAESSVTSEISSEISSISQDATRKKRKKIKKKLPAQEVRENITEQSAEIPNNEVPNNPTQTAPEPQKQQYDDFARFNIRSHGNSDETPEPDSFDSDVTLKRDESKHRAATKPTTGNWTEDRSGLGEEFHERQSTEDFEFKVAQDPHRNSTARPKAPVSSAAAITNNGINSNENYENLFDGPDRQPQQRDAKTSGDPEIDRQVDDFISSNYPELSEPSQSTASKTGTTHKKKKHKKAKPSNEAATDDVAMQIFGKSESVLTEERKAAERTEITGKDKPRKKHTNIVEDYSDWEIEPTADTKDTEIPTNDAPANDASRDEDSRQLNRHQTISAQQLFRKGKVADRRDVHSSLSGSTGTEKIDPNEFDIRRREDAPEEPTVSVEQSAVADKIETRSEYVPDRRAETIHESGSDRRQRHNSMEGIENIHYEPLNKADGYYDIDLRPFAMGNSNQDIQKPRPNAPSYEQPRQPEKGNAKIELSEQDEKLFSDLTSELLEPSQSTASKTATKHKKKKHKKAKPSNEAATDDVAMQIFGKSESVLTEERKAAERTEIIGKEKPRKKHTNIVEDYSDWEIEPTADTKDTEIPTNDAPANDASRDEDSRQLNRHQTISAQQLFRKGKVADRRDVHSSLSGSTGTEKIDPNEFDIRRREDAPEEPTVSVEQSAVVDKIETKSENVPERSTEATQESGQRQRHNFMEGMDDNIPFYYNDRNAPDYALKEAINMYKIDQINRGNIRNDVQPQRSNVPEAEQPQQPEKNAKIELSEQDEKLFNDLTSELLESDQSRTRKRKEKQIVKHGPDKPKKQESANYAAEEDSATLIMDEPLMFQESGRSATHGRKKKKTGKKRRIKDEMSESQITMADTASESVDSNIEASESSVLGERMFADRRASQQRMRKHRGKSSNVFEDYSDWEIEETTAGKNTDVLENEDDRQLNRQQTISAQQLFRKGKVADRRDVHSALGSTDNERSKYNPQKPVYTVEDKREGIKPNANFFEASQQSQDRVEKFRKELINQSELENQERQKKKADFDKLTERVQSRNIENKEKKNKGFGMGM